MPSSPGEEHAPAVRGLDRRARGRGEVVAEVDRLGDLRVLDVVAAALGEAAGDGRVPHLQEGARRRAARRPTSRRARASRFSFSRADLAVDLLEGAERVGAPSRRRPRRARAPSTSRKAVPRSMRTSSKTRSCERHRPARRGLVAGEVHGDHARCAGSARRRAGSRTARCARFGSPGKGRPAEEARRPPARRRAASPRAGRRRPRPRRRARRRSGRSRRRCAAGSGPR